MALQQRLTFMTAVYPVPQGEHEQRLEKADVIMTYGEGGYDMTDSKRCELFSVTKARKLSRLGSLRFAIHRVRWHEDQQRWDFRASSHLRPCLGRRRQAVGVTGILVEKRLGLLLRRED